MFKVAILGASGYTGLELVRLISMHPKFEIEYLSGDSKSGMKFGDVYPGLQYLKLPNLLSVSEINYEEIDAVFCALPHTKSANIINNLPTNIKVIDLSADFRLNSSVDYKKWYGVDHPCPEMLVKFIYGLTEFYRSDIKISNHVACTGCNSAAGLYNFSGKNIRITFTPHLLPQNRGILATIYVKGNLNKIYDTLYKKYENEKFINVMPLNTLISTKDVRGSNFCNISVCESSSPDTVILFSTLDNFIDIAIRQIF